MTQKRLTFLLVFYFVISISNGLSCNFQDQQVKCENFQSFDQLDFSNIDGPVDNIFLKPSNPLILNNSLDLYSLNFTQEYIVNLENIQAFQILSNPFAFTNLIRGKLYIQNSVFVFYKENQIVDFETCDYINRNELFVSLFDVFDLVSLRDNIIYSGQTCPSEFKHVKIEIFELYNLTKTNRLNFMKIPINDKDSDLNCTIDSLQIFNSEIDLDKSLIYPEVFRYIRFLFVETSNVTSIEEDLFKYFENLKYFTLTLNNFRKFIRGDNSWMKYLNHGVKVNLSDASEIYRNRENQMLFEMNDLKLEYDFPESDFCFFSNFPHEKLVFPIINTKKSIKCSCTVIYLIKNKNFAKNSSSLITESVKDCLNDNFEDLVRNCDLEKKIAECSKKALVDYKNLAIIFIVVSVFLIIGLAVLVGLIITKKKRLSNFSIGFEPNLN